VVDFALGRSPISGNSRSTPRSNFVSTAPDQNQIRGQEGSRTEIRFTKSSENRSSFNEDVDDGEGERVDKIFSRLKTAQEELDSHLGRQSSEHRQNERSQQEDNHYYQYHQASPRVLTREGLGRDEERVIPSYSTNDIPLRFHAGRESLSVKKNITVRDLKRPKERSQDKDYKQRYSISPGHQIGVYLPDSRGDDGSFDRGRVTSHDERNGARMSLSGGNRPIRTPEIHTTRSSVSAPSPRNGDRARDGGNSFPFTITLIFNGEHQVWEDMQVTQ
jgi:hypothetical protein